MGYYTEYKLMTKPSDTSLISELRENCMDASYALDNNGDSDGSTKWYSFESDMKSFSKKYPNTLFLLEGEGEEPGDIWKAYFKDGKSFHTKAELVFEEFTEEKLK